jgi:hypothetical protein
MPGKRQLPARREDLDRSADRIVDEDRLREAELGRQRLSPRLRDRATIEEDAQRVPASSVQSDEHPQDMQLRHRAHRRMG